MRRRILFSTLLVSITAIVVLGVPLGFAFSGLIRSEQLRQLDREAGTLAATLENEQKAGRPITPALVNQLAGPDRYAQVSRRNSTGDEVIAAGRPPSGPRLRSVVATSGNVLVQLRSDG